MKFKKEAELKKMSVAELKKLHNEAKAERKEKYIKKKYTKYMNLINTIIGKLIKPKKKKLINASKFVSKQNIFLKKRENCIQRKIKQEYTPKYDKYKKALEQIQTQIDRQMKNKNTFCPKKDEKKCKKADLLHNKHVKRRTDKQKENEELEALRERIHKEGCKSHYSKLKF